MKQTKEQFGLWFFGRASLCWRALIGIILPVAIIFGISMGCYWLFALTFGEIPVDGRKVPFKDVLITVLTIAGIGIAVFGAGAYQLLSSRIEAKIQARADRNLWLARVKQTVDMGWLYWQLYLFSEGKPQPTRRFFLIQAIDETKGAVVWLHSNLDESERDVEQILFVARNNWAYYIYELDSSIEKVDVANKLIAIECIAYLEQRMSRFPELANQAANTIEKVAAHFRATTSQ